MKPEDAPPAARRFPTRASLRLLLSEIFIVDTELDAFCLDYFPEVYQQFSSGMNRDSKLTELIERVDAAELLARLREAHGLAIVARETKIKYQSESKLGSACGSRNHAVLIGSLAAAIVCAAIGYASVVGWLTGRVLILGGTFTMGSTPEEISGLNELCRRLHGPACRPESFEREQPARMVAVSAFWIDAREVDNARFAIWLSEQPGLKIYDETVYDGTVALVNLRQPESGIRTDAVRRFAALSGREQQPVARVTWAGARRYCAAKRLRLPTEAEWELAARGADRRVFPWGAAEPSCDGTIFGRAPGEPCESHLAQPASVGSAEEDRTPQGVRDLGGNVAEWVADAFTERYRTCNGLCRDRPQVDEAGDGKETPRVIRGGYFSARTEELRSSARGRAPANRVFTEVGFRCARSGVLFSE